MSDINVENYKKSVEKIVEIWGKEMDNLAKQLAPIKAELDKLEAIKEPSPDDKKRIDDLKKKCANIRKQIDDAAASLDINLKVIEVPPKADEKELVKLPDWLKEIIKKKGIPLGKHVTIVPKIDFDIKKKKLKSAGVTLKWEW